MWRIGLVVLLLSCRPAVVDVSLALTSDPTCFDMLDCSGSVAVSALEADGGVRASQCTAFAAQPGRTLRDLPALITGGPALAGLPGDLPLSFDVSVFGTSDCSGPLAYRGTSAAAPLDGGTVPLDLDCIRPPQCQTCSRYAAPSGSDSNPGTQGQPYLTVAHLVNHLDAGETGCLASGLYVENVDVTLGGADGHRSTLMSAPGGRATLRGLFWVKSSAPHYVLRNIDFDGSPAGGNAALSVSSDDVLIDGIDLTSNRLGDGAYVNAYGPVVHRLVVYGSRFHGFGGGQHGLQLYGTVGARLQNNTFYDIRSEALWLDPQAVDSVVVRNTFANNDCAVLFGSFASPRKISEGNLLRGNVMAFSDVRHVTELFQPDAGPTRANRLVGTCLWSPTDAGVKTVIASGSIVGDPHFPDLDAGRLDVDDSSPCAGRGAYPP